MNKQIKPILRCLHYLPHVRLEDGGVVRAVIDIIQNTSNAGIFTTLITHNSKDCPASWLNSDAEFVNVHQLPETKFGALHSPSSIRNTITDLIRQQDVVHLHTPWATLNPLFGKLATQLNKPYFITLHGMLDDWSMTQRGLKKRCYLRIRGRKLLEHAERVHCTAVGEKEQSQKWYPEGTPWVMPYIIDLTPYNPKPSPNQAFDHFKYLKRDGIKLLFLSRIHIKKGLDRLIEACGELKARAIGFQLAIAGPGDETYIRLLKQRINELGIAEHIHWLGMVSGDLKLSLYAASDVFVLPTSQENFGLVYPESLMCGTPVIATRGTDIWKELEQGGALICDLNPEAVANAMATMAQKSSGSLKELGLRGREFVKKWLDPVEITNAYRVAYEEAVSGRDFISG